MNGTSKALAVAFCTLQLASQSEAFTAPPSVPKSPAGSSKLGLVPDQGNHLVAAYNAACMEHEMTKNEATSVAAAAAATAAPIRVDKHLHGPIGASKSFLARVFHLPTVRHPKEEKDLDVVYYPMIGFRFFADIDTVFPTTSHNCCVLPTQDQKEEEVFGWFSPSCDLDFFSEDICSNPIGYGDEGFIMQ